MTLSEIEQQFELCKNWEERYRLLIQYSRKLPKLTAEELMTIPEIFGCESRLWFEFSVSPRLVRAYSDARLMQGLLFIIITAVSEQTQLELQQIDLQALFERLKITKHLTSTRLNGLKQIQTLIRKTVAD